MVHYLSDRRLFVQIDKTSSIETVLFGVPQGPILGLSIFNLFVSDLQKHIKCPCYQYSDDTTFFVHSKTMDLANSLKFIRLLRVVFSSQQRLNRPAVNAVQ